jgi:hypothetical protein
MFFFKFIIFTLLYNLVKSSLTKKEAIHNFGNCISEYSNKLEVRSLKDLYRIRGIPNGCCEKLSETLLSSVDLVNKGINTSDCRLNAFYINNGVFDLHNHPLHFISFIISGGYSHSIFSIEEDNKNKICPNNACFLPVEENEICSDHTVIDTATDKLIASGTVKLIKTEENYFSKDDIIIYDNSNEIHRIENFMMNTLTINYLTSIGSNIIDVFVSHKTPERKNVLSKADTRKPPDNKIIKDVIDKSINIFMNYE